ncbi:hypothetical protein T484DRAFT_2812419 [Baffinella frigidus]|nr:hypothetical protein T484DRAFT_2812419 [Cryptophyta sp. CCMP2293]
MEQERAQLSSSNPLDWLVAPFDGMMKSAASLAGNLPDSGAWGVSSGREGTAAGQASLGSVDWWGAGLLTPQVSQRNDQQIVAARSSQGSQGHRAVVESAFQEHGGVEFEEGSSRRSSYQEEEEYGSEDYDDEEEEEEMSGLIGPDGRPLPFATEGYIQSRIKENRIFFMDDMQLYKERKKMALVPYESLQVLSPSTPHPTPYTLHPTPYTLHPTPYTLQPTP